MRAGRVKSRSKKLCKFVHFCAGKHAYIFDRGLPLMYLYVTKTTKRGYDFYEGVDMKKMYDEFDGF